MPNSLKLEKYSFGVGDRFAHQGKAQLAAFQLAAKQGAHVTPVWNKSNREHLTIGSEPASTREAADEAVQAAGWTKPYHVDADHIRLETVNRFLPHADFYTIDVADFIGKPARGAAAGAFATRHTELVGRVTIPGIEKPFAVMRKTLEKIAAKYILAVQEAVKIYRHIEDEKGRGTFITEVSMDETDTPQSPLELLVILVALAEDHIPIQTIAPKFTGRFNKGVDYVGSLVQFERELHQDLAVIDYAIKRYGLPAHLKLSLHSGSDKFSLYAPLRRALGHFNAGVHVKTAGTTWLEELIGLAEAGGSGLAIAQEVYASSLDHIDELCAPYATVIDIDRAKLPSAATVKTWSSDQFVAALRHEPKNKAFNPNLRQLLHVGYKVAAKMGDRYLEALDKHSAIIARNVTTNIYERHLKPLFVDKA